MLSEKNNYKKAFSLLETLVAIAVLMIAIIAPIGLASRSIRASVLTRDTFIASFLAAEAIEFVRNARDENVINGDFWLQDLLPDCASWDDGCTIDVTQLGIGNSIQDCTPFLPNPCPAVKYHDSNAPPGTAYRYQHQNGDDTKFIRTVRIADLEVSNDAAVEVTVEWDGAHSLVLQENIFPWR